MNKLDLLAIKMMEYYAGDAKRIQHFIKVHSFARLIGMKENLPEHELYILEAAALTHDIGIKKAEEIYGRCDGPLQEQLGPAVAREMLISLDFDDDDILRICYLIANHHTYTNIDGKDYRILVEADFLVNLYADNAVEDVIKSAYDRIFRTDTGKNLCRLMFAI